MKKYFTIILVFFLTILSCEKDDFCVGTTTPNLVIRFYNNDIQTDVKNILLDSVWAIDKNGIEQYKNISINSIAIPLNLNENSTTYIIENNSIKDTLKFIYDRKDIFVSRSCGYKTIFKNFQIENNSINWIKNININNTIIENDTTAHISIFH